MHLAELLTFFSLATIDTASIRAEHVAMQYGNAFRSGVFAAFCELRSPFRPTHPQSSTHASSRDLALHDPVPLAPVPPGVFSSLAGGLLTDALDALEPGQSLTAEVHVDDPLGQSVRVGVEVRDRRGATFYEVVVTLRHAEPARQVLGG